MATQRTWVARTATAFALVMAAGGALIVEVGGASADPSKTPPPSGDVRATSVIGNETTCAGVGLPGDTQIGGDNSAGYNQDGWLVTNDGTFVNIVTIPSGVQIDATIVKGTDAYNVYPPTALTQLHAPIAGNSGGPATVSHWFICAGAAGSPSPSDSTSASVSPSSSTSTSVSPSSSTSTSVSPTDSTSVSPTESTSVSPTESTSVLPTETERPLTDPAVTFSTACKTGITALLSNMNADNTTNTPVTFTVTGPDGTVQTVTVLADHIVKLKFPVKEDTTGVVSVQAPGLAKHTKSYVKNCTTVLGEKVTKPVTKPVVQGEKTTKLPFTGWPVATAVRDAGIALAAGLMLLLVAARRRRQS